MGPVQMSEQTTEAPAKLVSMMGPHEAHATGFHEGRNAALKALAEAVRVRPCDDDRYGVYLHGARGSYIGLSNPVPEDAAHDWRARIIATMVEALDAR